MRFDFLLCSERSGSNLITQMLDSHSAICGTFPSHLMLRVGRHVYRYGDLSQDDNWQQLLADVAEYLAAMHSEWRTTVTAAELRESVQQRSFGAIFRFVYEREAVAWGKQRLFVKDNHAYTSFGFVEATFDEPNWVVLVRDPRDMAYTWKANAMEPGGVGLAAECWKRDQAAALEMMGHLAPAGRVLLARFEDLIRTPERELTRVCEALGVAYEPGMLDFHRKPLLKTNSSNLSSWTDLQKPLDPTNTGVYRGRLSDDEVRYVEAICEEEMAFLGYGLDHPRTESVEALKAKLPTSGFSDDEPTDTEVAIFERWYAVRDRIATRRPDGSPVA
ncbi:MAG: sulfotransferase [Myxococcales bacterium]|nr:sulfotransferase [Myxococcales bacterium]